MEEGVTTFDFGRSSITVWNIHIKLYGCVQNIPLEGILSQNFDLGFGFIFRI